MKKLSILLVFMFTASIYAKQTGPSPFWYSISEKILAGTHQLLSPDDSPCKSIKKPKIKSATTKAPLKCQPKQDKKILPTPNFTINSSGVWIDSE